MSENSLLYFDAWTEIGPRPDKHPLIRWRLEHLLEEMEHCAISGALVANTQSVHYDPMLGNRRLSHWLEAHTSKLHALWNLLPPGGGEFPERFGPLLRDHGVRAVTVHPASNGWELLGRPGRALLDEVASEEVPLWIKRSEVDDLTVLERLLKEWPTLQIVLTGAVWSEQRAVLPLLDAYPQLHLTFERFQINEGPEDLCAKGLERQLLFGSGAPQMSMGAHRCYIDYAAVPLEKRRMMAGENLARLLGVELPVAAPAPANDDPIMQAARAGEPLPTEVIDLHMHILDEGLNGGGGHYRMSRGGPEGVFAMLRRLGVSGGGFMSWNGTVSADAVEGNQCTTAALDAAPEGIWWGLASFDPTHYSQEELAGMIPEVYRDPRMIGMKPYWIYGVAYDDPMYDLWWRYGQDHQLYALIHRTRDDFSEVTTLAQRYPDVQWVVAHCGGSFGEAQMAIEAIRRFPNIHAEITLTPVWLGIIEELVRGCGVERVLYGSDLPMRDPRQQLGWVVYSRLSLEEKRSVLGRNALALLKPLLERAVFSASSRN